ncbi:MAG: hypothetical protein ACJAYC_003345 [Halieaceae bacterium]|jgi:hypothetical protein
MFIDEVDLGRQRVQSGHFLISGDNVDQHNAIGKNALRVSKTKDLGLLLVERTSPMCLPGISRTRDLSFSQ